MWAVGLAHFGTLASRIHGRACKSPRIRTLAEEYKICSELCTSGSAHVAVSPVTHELELLAAQLP